MPCCKAMAQEPLLADGQHIRIPYKKAALKAAFFM